jgi:cytochrome c-type protein NapB
MSTETNTTNSFSTSRTAVIMGAIALGLGIVGYWQGMNQPANVSRPAAKKPIPTDPQIAAAPRYHEINARANGPNRDWSSQFSSLNRQAPELFAPVTRTPEMKQAALVDRLRTRAFDGAPPTIPHPIEQQSAASCMVCHAQGLKLADKIATRISHANYSSCTQCHVESATSLPTVEGRTALDMLVVKNEFSGVVRSGPGQRAMPGAPPMIPHTLQMRQDCLSCHGLIARPGLRTTHPWLQNCVQCHVANEAAETPLSSLSETLSAVTQP